LLREAVETGADHIDTAQFFGSDVVNELIREALYPDPDDLILASKVGASRDDQGRVLAPPKSRPSSARASRTTSALSASTRFRLSTPA
jgi:pyridoxine 4-dehydrogenase